MMTSVTAGCTGGQRSGTPSPQASASAAPSPSTAPAPGKRTRPVDLPLTGVQPCDLFTEAVRQRFELQGAPTAGTDERGQPDCQLRSTAQGGYLISAAHSEGMERFDNIPEQLATVRRFDLAGYPAAELRDVNQPFACLIGIDVADGQHLGVYVSDAPRGGTRDEICRSAVTFAEAVLASLRQRLGR